MSMKPTYEQLEAQVLELSVKLANVESKCAVLAVENDRAVNAVTVFSNVTHDITEIICDELGQERVAEIVAAYNDLGNMPATDAYLAEVRAQGVDMVIAAKKHQREIMHADTFGYGAAQESLRTLINQLESFAAQLRQGAEHE